MVLRRWYNAATQIPLGKRAIAHILRAFSWLVCVNCGGVRAAVATAYGVRLTNQPLRERGRAHTRAALA